MRQGSATNELSGTIRSTVTIVVAAARHDLGVHPDELRVDADVAAAVALGGVDDGDVEAGAACTRRRPRPWRRRARGGSSPGAGRSCRCRAPPSSARTAAGAPRPAGGRSACARCTPRSRPDPPGRRPRKRGARPKPSSETSPETTRRTQPPATSHSIGIPATTATTVRSLTRRRASVRTNAIGAAFIDRPPIPIVAPSGISSAASSSVRSFDSWPAAPTRLANLPAVWWMVKHAAPPASTPVPDSRAAYRERGSGLPIVFLHGGTGTGEHDWGAIAGAPGGAPPDGRRRPARARRLARPDPHDRHHALRPRPHARPARARPRPRRPRRLQRRRQHPAPPARARPPLGARPRHGRGVGRGRRLARRRDHDRKVAERAAEPPPRRGRRRRRLLGRPADAARPRLGREPGARRGRARAGSRAPPSSATATATSSSRSPTPSASRPGCRRGSWR